MDTTLKQNELLQSQNTTSETHTNNSQSNSELVEKEHQEGTGFDIVGNKEKGYFIAIGNYRLTNFNTKEELKKKIKNKDWEIILGLIQAGIESNEKLKSETLAKAYQGVNRTMHNDEQNK